MSNLRPEEQELVDSVREHGDVVIREFSNFMNAVLRRLRNEVAQNRPPRQEDESDTKDNSKFEKIGKNKAFKTKIYNKKKFGK
jgi:hypothetical protein